MKLKNCPICKSPASRHITGGGWGNEVISCTNSECGLSLEGDAPCAGKHYTEKGIKAWNTDLPPTAGEIQQTLFLFRAELDKNMNNSSGSPGHDAMTIALGRLFA